MRWHLSPALIEVIGFAAGTLTTLSFIPQVVKAWRSRSTGDLSTLMLAAFSGGVALWLLYGLLLKSLPMIVTNATTLGLSGALLVLKLRGR